MNFLQMSHTNKILIGWKCHIRPEDKRGGKVEKSCCYFLYLLRNRYISIEDKHSLKKKRGGNRRFNKCNFTRVYGAEQQRI